MIELLFALQAVASQSPANNLTPVHACIREQVDRYATLDEAAPVIARAAMIGCRDEVDRLKRQVRAMIEALPPGRIPRSSLVEAAERGIDEGLDGFALQTVMDRKVARQTAARTR